MFSPMGGKERTSVYLVGDFDYDTGKFFYTISGEIDWDLIIMHHSHSWHRMAEGFW